MACILLRKNLLCVGRNNKNILSTGLSIMQSLQEKEKFEAALPGIMNTLVNSPRLSGQPEVALWIKQVIDYTLRNGRKSRGLATVHTYKMLEKPENITKESMHLAHVLGWAVEMIRASSLIVDDIVDQSLTRHGKTSWYRVPGVGSAAIIDSNLMYFSMIDVLNIYLKKTPYYLDALRVINEGLCYTIMGEHVDFITSNRKNFDDYTMTLTEDINTYKAAYFTYRMIVMLGTVLVKNMDERLRKEIGDISLEIGKLYQMQNDYLDVYCDESLTGKVGTDIQVGKCSWVAAAALQRCNDVQLKIFKQFYGSRDPMHVKRIKQLYDELEIQATWKEYERRVCDDILRKAHLLPSKNATSLIVDLLNISIKRIH